MGFAVEMRNITKVFPGVVANDNVTFTAEWGKICGLVGENGAGKTTLMKTLYGMYHPDGGEILINGEKASFSSPKDAIALRIAMVHQHFALVPSMTVAENVVIGNPPKKHGFVDLKKAVSIVNDLSIKHGLDIKPNEVTSELPVGLKQRVEILKALYLGADILILDEPTAVLTPQEIVKFFEILHSLKEHGCTIILITHKLAEIMAVTDEVTVMRNGKVTGKVKTSDTNEMELARMMVARDVLLRVKKDKANPYGEGIEVKNLTYKNSEGISVVNNVSFSVKQGEIVGIAGVQGNGQTELIELLSGMVNDYNGEIKIGNTDVKSIDSPLKRRELGLGHIPEDRQITGAALEATILDNFIMTIYKRPEMSRHGLINFKKARSAANEYTKLFAVKTTSINEFADSLSGGNMQKVIVAREFYLKPLILMACQPTRGVDIGATEFIHNKMIEIRDKGSGVLLVSNELSEIMSLSDRIIVMFKGQIIGEVTGEDATEELLGLLMAGIPASPEKKKGDAVK